MLNAERRAHAAQNALEETKTMLEQADRARRQAEQELCDTNEQLADLTVQHQGLSSAKRKLESDLTDLRVRLGLENVCVCKSINQGALDRMASAVPSANCGERSDRSAGKVGFGKRVCV
jgi:chromosome segregation ATPase